MVFTHPTDCNTTDGTIQITASGGTGSFDYSIDGGQNWQGLGIFTDLSGGAYDIQIRNSNETCVIAYGQQIILIEPEPPIMDQILSSNPTDCGLADGTIQFITQGSGSYEYSIDGGISWQDQPLFESLPEGNYFPQLRNANGTCGIDNLMPIQLIAPIPPTITFIDSFSPNDCDTNNGMIQIHVAATDIPLEYSIDGGNTWGFNANFLDLPGGTYHVIVRNQNSNCPPAIFNQPINLIAPSQPAFSNVEVSPISDCGLLDGSITISGEGGSGNFLYGLQLPDGATAWQTTPEFSFLPPGTYLPLLRNIDNSCEVEYFQSVEITSLSLPVIDEILASDPTNCDVQDGFIQIQMFQSEEVEFSIDGGMSWQDDPLFSGLPEGSYDAQVRNTDGTCLVEANSPINLEGPQPPPFEVDFENPTDCDVANGEITITSSTNEALLYSIDGGQTWNNSGFFSNLSDGIYDIFVQFENGTCPTPYGASIQLLAPAQPQFTIQYSPISDCGLSDGVIDIQITGGSGNFEFSIDNGDTWHATSIFTDLSPNTYQITVRNEDGTCPTEPYALTLEAPSLPTILSILPENPTNCGTQDGSIQVIAAGGNGQYLFSINGGQSWQASNLFQGLAAGDYQVMIQNQDGSCANAFEQPISLTDPLAPEMEVTSTNPTDCGNDDGSITIHISNADIEDYQFFMFDGIIQASNVFTGLAAGSYQIFAISSSPVCPVSFEAIVEIIAPVPPSFSYDYNHPSDCGSNDGSITFQTSNNEENYQYSIDNGNTWQSTPNFSELSAGTYHLTARNENGSCATEAISFGLNDPEYPEIIVEAEQPSDCGVNDGIITILSVNGSNHEYSINGGLDWSSASTFSGLTPGSYSILARNLDGSCAISYEQPISIAALIPPTMEVEAHQPTDCFLENGMISISATGGSGSYEYSIDNGINWSSQSLFENLGTGTYEVLVRNEDETCPVNSPNPVLIEAPEPPQVEVNFSHPTDCEVTNGIIAITASGGQGSYEYSIDNGEHWSASSVFDGLDNGSYSVVVRHTDGSCQIPFQDLLQLNSPNAPVVEVISGNPTDCGLTNGWIQVFASGGSGNFEYSINNGQSWHTTPVFGSLPPDNYQISVRNDDGTCRVDINQNIEIVAPEIPEFDALLESPTFCGAYDGSIYFETTTTGNYNYSINDGQTWQSQPTFSDLAPGDYFLTIRSENGGCISEESQMVTLEEPELLSLEVSETHPSDCGSNDGSISILTDLPSTFEYSINGGQSWQSSPHFLELPEGAYLPMARQVGGDCETTNEAPIELTAPTAPVFEVIGNDPTNCESPNGFISIFPTGSDPLEYSIDDGATWQTTPNFLNLAANTYSVMARNQDGSCETNYPTPVTLSAPYLPEYTVSYQSPQSCTGGDGTITIDNQGNTQLEYSIDQGITWHGSNQFTDLSEGSYSITVRTIEDHCEQSYDQLIELVAPSTPEISLSSQSPTDCGVSNGMININHTASDLEFSIDDGETWSQQATFMALSEGTYKVKIRHQSGGCEQEYPQLIILEAPTLPDLQQIDFSHPTDCGLNDGSISINDLTATGIYEYSIDGGNSWHYQTTFLGLPGGTYPLGIRNAEGNCVKQVESIQLNAPIPPQINAVQTHDPSECGLDDGKIVFQTGHPVYPYQYSIDNGESWSSSPSFINLSPGSHQLKVKNQDGSCEQLINQDITLIAPQLPEIEAIISEAPDNCQQDNGSISINLSNDSADIQYSINGGNDWFNQKTFTGLSPGVYYVAIRSGNCEYYYESPIILDDIEPLIAQVTSLEPPICSNTEDGTISIIVEGGQEPFTFEWSNGQTGNQAINLPGGDYEVTVRDARGCEAYLTDIQLPNAETFTVDLGPNIDTTVCLGQSIEFSFPDTTWLYSWTSDNEFSSDSASVSLNQSGTYWLEVTNEMGCTAVDSISLNYLEAFFDADFLLPEDGVINESIVAVDISWPIADSISWEYNQDSIWHQESIANHEVVTFPETGTYNIRMYAYHGDCYGVIDKQITIHATADSLHNQDIQPADSEIIQFSLFPNPNDGTFDVNIGLSTPQDVTLWIFREDGLALDTRQLNGANAYMEHFAFANLHPGLYTVVLQTQSEWLHLNFVVE